MKTAKKGGHARFRRLAEVRDRHVKRLKKVEKARMKLEKAREKLQKLEAEIALLASSADARPQRLDQGSAGSGDLRPARLIFNPRSKGARNGPYRLENIVDRLRAYGIRAEVGLKTSGRVARMLAKEAVEQGMDLVIVAAGDGAILSINRGFSAPVIVEAERSAADLAAGPRRCLCAVEHGRDAARRRGPCDHKRQTARRRFPGDGRRRPQRACDPTWAERGERALGDVHENVGQIF